MASYCRGPDLGGSGTPRAAGRWAAGTERSGLAAELTVNQPEEPGGAGLAAAGLIEAREGVLGPRGAAARVRAWCSPVMGLSYRG